MKLPGMKLKNDSTSAASYGSVPQLKIQTQVRKDLKLAFLPLCHAAALFIYIPGCFKHVV